MYDFKEITIFKTINNSVYDSLYWNYFYNTHIFYIYLVFKFIQISENLNSSWSSHHDLLIVIFSSWPSHHDLLIMIFLSSHRDLLMFSHDLLIFSSWSANLLIVIFSPWSSNLLIMTFSSSHQPSHHDRLISSWPSHHDLLIFSSWSSYLLIMIF